MVRMDPAAADYPAQAEPLLAERPPCWRRWERLMVSEFSDSTARLSHCFLICGSMYSFWNRENWWLDMLLLAALHMGVLVLLDYRDWVQLQISREASKVDPGVSVSCMLELSCANLQEQFYEWMGRTSAVVLLQPWMVWAFHNSFWLRLMWKDQQHCGKLQIVAATLPCTVFISARVILESHGASKEVQSMASLLSLVFIYVPAAIGMAVKDPCMVETMGSAISPTALPSEFALLSAVHALGNFIVCPCTMGHLPALAYIIVIGNNWVGIVQYLQRNDIPVLDAVDSYLGIDAFWTIGMTTCAVVMVGVAIRYNLAHTHMIQFLKTIRPQHRNN